MITEDYKALANEGFTIWFDSLPDDDWSEDYERAILVRWDPSEGWVEESQ